MPGTETEQAEQPEQRRPEIRIHHICVKGRGAAYYTMHGRNGRKLLTSRHFASPKGAEGGARRACDLFSNVTFIDQWGRKIPPANMEQTRGEERQHRDRDTEREKNNAR